MEPHIQAILQRTPNEPGVYLMRNKAGKVFYIGKATNLRSRLRSYFSGTDPRPFVRRLPRILHDVETVITRNPKEAMLVENRLIKVHQPRYNIKLRDDKNFLSLRIDTKANWPRVEVVRRQKKDGAHYFGPYHSASAVRHTLRVLNKYFGLRTCPDSVLNNRSRPCLQYQIKRCPGPCVFDVDREAYARSVRETILFLQGRHQELVDALEQRMHGAAVAWEFELAAHYRDQIKDVKRSLMTQQVETVRLIDQDVFGLYREGDSIAFELVQVRRGIITGTRRFAFTGQEFADEEALQSFLLQYYDDAGTAPHEVLISEELDAATTQALEEILGELRGGKVTVSKPQRGQKAALLDIAQRNARQALVEETSLADRRRSELEKLQARLHLTQIPRRIECFDISNLGNTAIVGSMVVFVDGEPAKGQYRTFKVRTVAGQDDFASMVEVLSRRVQRSQLDDNPWPWPDLMVIDGGKGQLNRVRAALEELGAHQLEVVALAKARTLDEKTDEDANVHSEERVFLPGVKDPIHLKPHTAEAHLMARIRDEAHRVAITFNKRLRTKRALGSVLDRIPGIGETRRRALLQHFGSVGRIRHATVDELAQVEGISSSLAQRIWQGLGGGEASTD